MQDNYNYNDREDAFMDTASLIKQNLELKKIKINEPLKIFKRKHQIWEKELEKLHTDLINLYKSYEETMNDYYDLIK